MGHAIPAVLAAGFAAVVGLTSVRSEAAVPVQPVRHNVENIDGIQVFYREAGSRDAPAVLLLHGYGASSHMFRDLMPRLAADYYVVAPDLPGFGFTSVPQEKPFAYTFDNLARVIDAFTEAKGMDKYAMYVFDYGAPVGWRLAVKHPERITAVISQNGNAYEEGLSTAWNNIRAAWKAPGTESRDSLRNIYTPEMTKWQYTAGVRDESLIAPETYFLAQAMIDRHGHEAQLDLILDYARNVEQYPEVHAYFRRHRPPTLAIWGKNDPFFLPAGASAFRRDNPDAEIEFLDTGHFALETHGNHIAGKVHRFLDRHLRKETDTVREAR